MTVTKLKRRACFGALTQPLTLLSLTTALVAGFAAYAQGGSTYFTPGNLVVSRSVYDNNANNVQVGETLPPNCARTTGGCVTGGATSDGTYPLVWNNAIADGSFGITSKIYLDQMTPSGAVVTSLAASNTGQLATSFSSKSEMALNLSTDHNYLTFMSYVSPIDALDISNSNTPGVVDPTNPVGENVFRAVVQVDQTGTLTFTKTNAYSGNNGRAAILNNTQGANVFYASGNAGNGSNPQPNGVITAAGAQIITPGQSPRNPRPVGSFNITQLGDTADKVGKDTNFRGLTIFDNVVYFSKGSGGNGINTVYFIDTTGQACPSTSQTPGIGLPQSSASLPTTGIAFESSLLQTEGVVPYNMCVLKGFPSVPNKTATTTAYPFGLWFANSTTLYVADEGDGTFADAGTETTAGLQKWIFNSTAGEWQLAYTLQAGLGLGVAYTVPGYPTGDNTVTGLPWAPETDGLRNVTGVVNSDGTATIYAITSTVSGNGDQGADPNRLVAITDSVSATAPPPTESFTTLRTARNLEVLRGVSFTPGTGVAEP